MAFADPALTPAIASRPPDVTNAHYDYWISGNPADAGPERTRGGMFLSGGGGHVPAAWKWFVDCSGGGDVVVLTASGADAYQSLVFEKIGGVDSVETIKFKDGDAARDPRVLEIIARADGIFLGGGKQTRYAAWWKESPVAGAINAHVRAHRPLGGSSAGLAILGEYYYASINGSVRGETALSDPFHRMIDLEHDFIKAPALEGVLTDTHFSNRQRLGRLLVFLGRTMTGAGSPQLVGLGIDEATALCVEPDGMGRLFTEKDGRAWLVQPTLPPEQIEAGKPLVLRHVRVTGIGPDSIVNLPKREVARPAVSRSVSAFDGAVHDDP